ncbi:MAG: virulence protein RhuM/Fic/DOC family protein [Arcobacter sp.]|uniref:virulence RhuM family protein n=1 Tax=Arcobacter sp. TaxID=1872629 RepID=UPI003C75CB87
MNNIIIYEDGNVELSTKVENDTLWLSQKQLCELFERDKSVISRHIRNIFKDEELDKDLTVAKNATVQKEGTREVLREVEYYNLDMIISVGYRINSKKATQFRQWATKVLKQYLINGYALNKDRLQKQKLDELDKTLQLIKSNIESKELNSEVSKGFVEIISTYAKEQKASNLLYYIIKGHPFNDGNKRIGAYLFILFLSKNNSLYKSNGELKINDNALASLALLVATSKPEQKDIIIKLIMNILYEDN